MINGAFVFSMLKGTRHCILDHVLILLFQLTIQNNFAGCFPSVLQLEVTTVNSVISNLYSAVEVHATSFNAVMEP